MAGRTSARIVRARPRHDRGELRCAGRSHVAAREPCRRGAEAARAAGAPPRATPAPGEAQAEAPQARRRQAQAPQAQAPEAQAPETQAEAEDPGPAAEGYVVPATSYFSYPNRQPCREARDPQPRAEVDQQHLGWPADQPRHPAAGQRHHPDRHVVLRRLGHRPGPRGRTQAGRQRADRRGEGQRTATTRRGHWLRAVSVGSWPPRLPPTRETVSFARALPGSCRGPGGTAHAKYFLFHNVGPPTCAG